jgi:hypothetical protein
MNPIRFATVIAVLIGTLFHWGKDDLGQSHAGMVLSTVQQDGLKVDYNGNLTSLDQLPNASRPGSASRIGTFDFEFVDLPNLYFIRARIRLFVQLPPDAVSDFAPQLVFSKVLPGASPDLDAALITGDAVKTDIKISFDLFPSGLGIVEKEIDFQDLTKEQSLKLSSILSNDPQQRVSQRYYQSHHGSIVGVISGLLQWDSNACRSRFHVDIGTGIYTGTIDERYLWNRLHSAYSACMGQGPKAEKNQ